MSHDPSREDEGARTAAPASGVAWVLRRDVQLATCSIEPAALQTVLRVTVDGTLVIEHAFPSPAAALIWSDDYRNDLLRAGWVPVEPAAP